MADDIITIINKIVSKEGMLDGIQFNNMYHKSTLSYLYINEVGYGNDDSYMSNNDWKDKVKREEDVKLLFDMNIDEENFKILIIWVKKTNSTSTMA